jgi:hypothetical protein
MLAMLSTAALVTLAGCGARSYDYRLEKTLEAIRYQRRLDANLTPPAKGKLETLLIYVRPPKNLAASKEFLMTIVEPGKFDVTETFTDASNLMHVLARAKLASAPGKKAAPPPANRGEFNADVLGLLGNFYNIELDSAKAKEEKKRNNTFKHLSFEANGKNVHVYLFGTKANPPEVALIFEYPKSEQAALASKIDLCLESFATGERARRAFSGGGDEGPGTPEGGAPGAVTF